MLSIKPIPESQASQEISKLYQSVKDSLNLASTPLIFQYFAVFPQYFAYLWQQLLPNFTDQDFKKQIQEVENFSLTAINSIYKPNAATNVFVATIAGRVEQLNLLQFTTSLRKTNALLYLLTLGIRESVKGMYLGIRKIGERVSYSDRTVFEDLSEGFYAKDEKKVAVLTTSRSTPTTSQGRGLATAPYQEFFKLMQWEMKALVKKEDYLFRRVELERFALSKLDRLPYPLETSFASVARFSGNDPKFYELLYIIAELFPTQAPYKLLASAMMTKALIYERSAETKNPQVITLPSGTFPES